MCGIVGLFLKTPAHEPALGALLADMLVSMGDRGPDSAGLAVYTSPAPGRIKLSLTPDGGDIDAAAAALGDALGCETAVHDSGAHPVLTVPESVADEALAWTARSDAPFTTFGAGRAMEIVKGVGRPESVVERYSVENFAGSHGIGHTRMATESAVTLNGAHPFSTGLDQCLVHNGSLSNHNSLRLRLADARIACATENDSEVAAGYLTWKMREGLTLAAALEAGLSDLDGFYTFVVATATGFAVLRDPVAWKPAVLAETDDWVAFGSEYRALAGLPGVAGARLWEPEPARVYSWTR